MTAFYRALLRLYPSSFRLEYVAELTRPYEDRGRNRGRVGATLAAITDVVPNAIAPARPVLRDRSKRMADLGPLAGEGMRETAFYSRSEGSANTSKGNGRLSLTTPKQERPDTFSYDPANPVPSRGGSICCTGNPTDVPGSFDQYLPPGHRLRVEIASSNFPRFDRNLNTGGRNYDETTWRRAKNAVHHTAAYALRLILPVVR